MYSKAKYAFALNKHGIRIHISDVPTTKSDRDTYRCIGCLEKLIPKIGQKKRIPHFAHDNLKKSCESYLHKLGKIVFHVEYLKCKDTDEKFEIIRNSALSCKYLKNYIIEFRESHRNNRGIESGDLMFPQFDDIRRCKTKSINLCDRFPEISNEDFERIF